MHPPLAVVLLAFLLAGVVADTTTATAAATGAAAPAKATWWKGNLHTHSLWSDGDDFPEMIAAWYRDRNYHFLALSDHNVLSQGQRWMTHTQVLARARGEPWRGIGKPPPDPLERYLAAFGRPWVETRTHPASGQLEIRLKPFEEFRTRLEQPGRFLLLQAAEITQQTGAGRALHVGAIHLGELIPTQPGRSVPEVLAAILRAARESGARTGRQPLIHVNHPNYKWGVTAEDLASLVDEPFVEVWNGVDGDNDPGDDLHPSTDEIWDIANTLRLAGLGAPPLFGLASDDAHDYHGTRTRAVPGRAWIMVRARVLSPEHLLAAIRTGDFYASTGVTLDEVRFDPATRRLSLVIRGEPGESYVTRFVGSRRGVNLQGKPRLGAAGTMLDTTLDYRVDGAPAPGEVFTESKGLRPSYPLRGDELYVRAIVTSTARPDRPSTESQAKRAWTQPVGWTLPGPGARP